MGKNQFSLGLIIILAGITILLGKFGVFAFLGEMFWPLFILVPGILLHLLYFGRLFPVGVLIPGGILTTYSLMFIYCNIVGWQAMGYLWPGFILGVAIGLYEFYLFYHGHPKGVLIASIILASIATGFFIITLLFSVGIYFIAVALILIGGWMILARKNLSN